MIASILSVRQPWAWLICAGFKDVENRTWTTNYRGDLFIHAGKLFDWSALNRIPPRVAFEVCKHFGIGYQHDPVSGISFTRKGKFNDAEFGAIVGKAILFGVCSNSSGVWAEPGAYHWIMKRPLLIEPIPMNGRLGVFRAEVPDEIRIIGNAGRCLR